MSSFLRFAGIAAFIVSLGLAVQALSYVPDVKIPVPCGTDAISKVIIKLVVDGGLEVKLRALLALKTIAEIKIALAVITGLFRGCADDLLKIGAGVVAETEATTSIVACFSAIITLFVKIFLQLSVKFGITAVVALCAEIDVVIRECLVNLEVCIAGVLALIVKACLYITVSVLAHLKLDLCADVLAHAGMSA
ncbi:hypothetical protein RSOLAG1IB_10395 [Rhizoctonia solani AG-1 IB]|uniref:Transmembrane protein n=1 Tax=Thanatephorus cucumeris (strain AG1-IB / isolate 7/3/14) TaxID=1108050 RepID=M5C7U6_THACB|nr:hypothetical protein BN14_05979 [Rhizoctonia solani AG-1 IB]CEL62342.1 hypothetical protein RSOLAG1IB_10395 [Rhizoctonia solani AG-1 IB]